MIDDLRKLLLAIGRECGLPIYHLLHKLIHDLDPRAAEFLTAQLSLWFALVFITSDSPSKPQPVALWVLWCLLAGTTKIVGVVATLVWERPPLWTRVCRYAGNLAGIGFWSLLAAIFYLITRGDGIVWGGYVIVALAQLWSFYRLARNR